MFENYPDFNPYRAMKESTPQMVGEDVYGLQIALNAVGEFAAPIPPDGIFGPKTAKAVTAVQKKVGVGSDGIAGGVTQRALVKKLAEAAAARDSLPTGLPYGQIAHESSCLLGNYSPRRPDRSYDAGVCQRNTNFTVPKEGFDPVKSITVLADRERNAWLLYQGVESPRRRWELACGSWNAPAFANYIARQEGATRVSVASTAKPTDSARAVLERYMDSTTAYLKL